MLPFSSTSANFLLILLSCRGFRVSLQQHDDFGIFSGDLRSEAGTHLCCALTPMSAPLRFSTRCGLGRPVGTESCPKNEVSNGYVWLKIGCFAKPSTSINVVFRYLNNIILWIQVVGTPTLINKNLRSLRKFRTSGALGL